MNHSTVKIAPSLLSADLLHLADEIRAVEAAGAEWLHVDVMDGRYVPNITFGPDLVRAARRATQLPLDVHLMIAPAQPHIKAFAEAGASVITIHPDADVHTHRVLSEIRSLGVKAGVALNPGTPVDVLDHLYPFVDLILVMTVNPGFGGQSFIEPMLKKIQAVRQGIDQSGFKIALEVDGGINPTTAVKSIAAGAEVLVAGAAVFSQPSRNYGPIIHQLRGGKG